MPLLGAEKSYVFDSRGSQEHPQTPGHISVITVDDMQSVLV